MPNRCELSGRGVLTGNRVSHANNKVKCRLLPNLHRKRYYIPELRRTVTLRLSTKAIKTISKRGGITQAILQEKPENLSPKLMEIRKALLKPKKRKNSAPAQA